MQSAISVRDISTCKLSERTQSGGIIRDSKLGGGRAEELTRGKMVFEERAESPNRRVTSKLGGGNEKREEQS